MTHPTIQTATVVTKNCISSVMLNVYALPAAFWTVGGCMLMTRVLYCSENDGR